MDEEQQPTLKNPFEIRQQQKVLPAKPKPPEPSYAPTSYEVSSASVYYIKQQVEKNKLELSDLPIVYKIALILCIVWRRREFPSITEIEIATMFRSLERAQKIASGEELLDLSWYGNNQESMPRKDRIVFWKDLAQIVVDNYEKF